MVSLLSKIEASFIDNPNIELYLESAYFLNVGLQSIKLTFRLMPEMVDIAKKHSHICCLDEIPCASNWIAK